MYCGRSERARIRKSPEAHEPRAAVTLVRKRGEVGAHFCPFGTATSTCRHHSSLLYQGSLLGILLEKKESQCKEFYKQPHMSV